MRFRYSLGALLATIALVCAFLATGANADSAKAQLIATIVNPVIVALAVVAWVEPGRISRTVAALFRGMRRLLRRRR